MIIFIHLYIHKTTKNIVFHVFNQKNKFIFLE